MMIRLLKREVIRYEVTKLIAPTEPHSRLLPGASKKLQKYPFVKNLLASGVWALNGTCLQKNLVNTNTYLSCNEKDNNPLQGI